MAVRQNNRQKTLLASDIDHTYNGFDSGRELLHRAGICDRSEFDDFISEFYDPELGESNQLITAIDELGLDRDRLEETARSLEPQPRQGIESLLEHRYRNDLVNIGSSAGWEPAIEHSTNGFFHDIIAGSVEPWNPNGRYQKDQRLSSYIEENGLEELEPFFIGDSNGDLEAIRYAAEEGGTGIAYGETLQDARENVEEASTYIGGDTAAAAFIVERSDDMDIGAERFIDRYGLEPSGSYELGELATPKDREAARKLEETLYD